MIRLTSSNRCFFGGWVLGIPFIIALALAGEAVGIGGTQFLAGVGIGAGVGLMQGRAIRSILNAFGPWFWPCAIGLGAPFLVTDIAGAIG